MTNDVRDTTIGSAEKSSAPADDVDLDVDNPDEATTVGDDAATDSPTPTKRRRRRISPALRRTVYVVVALLFLSSAGIATWLYFKQYRPDQQTDSSVKEAVAASASDGMTALLSYSSDTLDQDFANAKSHLAGDFLNYYNDFTQQIVAPAAKQRPLKTSAHVTGAAVTELHPDSATVLVFVDQTTTAKDSPQPSLAFSSLLVHMARINGKWLITKFNPV